MTLLRDFTRIPSEIIRFFCSAEPQTGARVVADSEKLFNSGFPVRIVQHCRVAKAIAEVHLDADDLWLCMEGEASFVCGGRLIEPIEQVPGELTFLAPSIVEGKVVNLKKGDWLLIPAGQPHQPVTSLSASLAIVKLPAREGRVQLDYLLRFNIGT